MESPFKGKTGLRRIWNAFHYSLDGLTAAYRHEDAFRQEIWLTLVAIPLALWLGDSALARAMMIGNSAILIDSWLHEVTYGAQFLLHMVNYLSSEEPINLEIASKTLVREQLNIPQPWVPILIIVLLPLMVAATAIPVLLKRRRR